MWSQRWFRYYVHDKVWGYILLRCKVLQILQAQSFSNLGKVNFKFLNFVDDCLRLKFQSFDSPSLWAWVMAIFINDLKWSGWEVNVQGGPKVGGQTLA